jgi:cell division protein ZapA (FtsZ GTPase activity inhibitor)
MSRPVKIQLRGQTFTIRTDETDEHIAEVTALVNERLAALGGPGAQPERALALLASLTLADDLVKLQRSDAALRVQVRSGIEAIMEQAAAR